MKADWSHLECFRLTPDKDRRMGTNAGDKAGAFFIPRVRTMLRVIASSGCDEIPWEHVSVSARDYKGERCPTWQEMCLIKDYFWDEEECVMQLHPPRSDYVNQHQFVLHLWKPLVGEIPRPPSIAVGIKGARLV